MILNSSYLKKKRHFHIFFKFPKHIFNSENINLLIAIELLKINLFFFYYYFVKHQDKKKMNNTLVIFKQQHK